MAEVKRFEIHDEDWVKTLMSDLEVYMDKIYDQIEAGKEPKTESGMSFCPCTDCESREIFLFLAPRILHGEERGKLGFSTPQSQ